VFLGTPLEEPFRVVVWLFIGLPILALILWVGLQLLLIKLTAVALVWAVLLAMVGYLLGIPWAIARAVTDRHRGPSQEHLARWASRVTTEYTRGDEPRMDLDAADIDRLAKAMHILGDPHMVMDRHATNALEPWRRMRARRLLNVGEFADDPVAPVGGEMTSAGRGRSA
jgi:hypothetical protein